MPKDENAETKCSSTDTGLTCGVTCKSGYIFSDGTNKKTVSCLSQNTWSALPLEPCQRKCVIQA